MKLVIKNRVYTRWLNAILFEHILRTWSCIWKWVGVRWRKVRHEIIDLPCREIYVCARSAVSRKIWDLDWWGSATPMTYRWVLGEEYYFGGRIPRVVRFLGEFYRKGTFWCLSSWKNRNSQRHRIHLSETPDYQGAEYCSHSRWQVSTLVPLGLRPWGTSINIRLFVKILVDVQQKKESLSVKSW